MAGIDKSGKRFLCLVAYSFAEDLLAADEAEAEEDVCREWRMPDISRSVVHGSCAGRNTPLGEKVVPAGLLRIRAAFSSQFSRIVPIEFKVTER